MSDPTKSPLEDPNSDIRKAWQDAKDAMQWLHDALREFLIKNNCPAWLTEIISKSAAGWLLVGRVLYIGGMFLFVNVGTTLAKMVLATITQIRKDGAKEFAGVTAEAVGEFMAIDTEEVDFATGKDAASSLKRAEQLGGVFVDMLQKQFGEGGVQSPDAGEKAAKALSGYGINFAVSNAFIGLMIEVATDGKFANFAELGEEVAQNLGLGRLTRQALRPLVQHAITQPYGRKMAAQYRSSILGTGELVKAYYAPRMDTSKAKSLLAQHGLSDDLIDELIEQQRPRLKFEDWELLSAMGSAPNINTSLQDVEHGTPNEVLDARSKVLTWHRLSSARNRVLSSVLSQIHDGFIDPSELDPYLTKFNVPQDEADLWRLAAGIQGERVRKRIDKGEMLFLYEASQVTDEDVQLWAEAEGYGSEDVQRILAFFRLKAVEASHKTSGGAAAKAAHIHKEHVAYVTDEITGIWSRKPTTAELNYWVTLLDTNERTKHDFLTELKALDTSGPAMPPATATS